MNRRDSDVVTTGISTAGEVVSGNLELSCHESRTTRTRTAADVLPHAEHRIVEVLVTLDIGAGVEIVCIKATIQHSVFKGCGTAICPDIHWTTITGQLINGLSFEAEVHRAVSRHGSKSGGGLFPLDGHTISGFSS